MGLQAESTKNSISWHLVCARNFSNVHVRRCRAIELRAGLASDTGKDVILDRHRLEPVLSALGQFLTRAKQALGPSVLSVSTPLTVAEMALSLDGCRHSWQPFDAARMHTM